MTKYDMTGCPNCDPEHAPKTEAAKEWLKFQCWGRGHYHPYVERDFHETAKMLIEVEREAAEAERERLYARAEELWAKDMALDPRALWDFEMIDSVFGKLDDD